MTMKIPATVRLVSDEQSRVSIQNLLEDSFDDDES
jgi:hypothetical protein